MFYDAYGLNRVCFKVSWVYAALALLTFSSVLDIDFFVFFLVIHERLWKGANIFLMSEISFDCGLGMYRNDRDINIEMRPFDSNSTIYTFGEAANIV